MENRLILHVGLQKTGTTAIQSFLEINTNILKRQRVNYIINPTRLYMAWPIYRNREDATVPVEELWKPIKLSLQHSSVMYSNESFSNIVEERPEFVLDLTKLLPENPITIIVYIRRQDLHYESLYGQNIVHGEFRKFNPSPSDDYMIFDYGQTTKVYEYSRWLNIMSDHLRPQDKLVVRVYERGAFESGSIFNDFISAGGLQWDPEFTIPEKTVNVSLDGRFIELARKMASFYKINGPKNYNFHFESSFLWVTLKTINEAIGITGNKRLFSRTERIEFMKKYEDTNNSVSKKFFNNKKPLFDESDLYSTANNEKDRFKEGECEMALILLNKLWIDIACLAKFRVLNYMRLKYYLKKRKYDRSFNTKWRCFFHKTIQSLGKRTVKNWGSVPQMENELYTLSSEVTKTECLIDEYHKFIQNDE